MINVFLQVYNLGTGRGYSVLEMIKAVEKASGKPVSLLTVHCTYFVFAAVNTFFINLFLRFRTRLLLAGRGI